MNRRRLKPLFFLMRFAARLEAAPYPGRIRSGRVERCERRCLLQAEAFAHQALEAGFVEQIVGEFLVGEHGEGGALGAGGEL